MNEQLLKDLVATAQQDEYNWDVVLDKFPELSEYDPQLLKDYVATVEKEDYNYDIANSKFPEFKFEQDEKAEYVDLDQDMLDEVFEAREAFTSQDLALQRKKEEEARKAKYNIDEIPGKYYIDGKEVDREILKNKLFDNDFINDLQDEKIQLEIPEEDYKLKSLADKQKKSGSRLGDLFESLERTGLVVENFKNAGLNYVEDIILETTGYKPGNTQLAYRVYRDMMSKANIEKRNKLRESQREYKDGFVNSIKNGNFADAANLGFRTTAESLPLMVLSSIPAIATRGKSVPTTQLLIKQALGSSGIMSGVLIPDEYEESRFSDDPKLKELTRGDKLTRAFLRGGAEGFFEGIMGPVGAKSFNVFKSGIRSQVRKTFNIAGKEAAQKISKELGDKTAKEIMKAFGINTALEGVTEALTSLGQDLTDDFYGVQDLTLEDYMNNAFEAFALGSFMGGTVQSLGATGKVFLRRNSVKQGAVSEIRKEQELGNISKKEGDLLIKKIEELQDAVNQTDSELSEEQQEKIATLIYEKNQLNQRIKGLDPNQEYVKKAKERILEIDGEISSVSESDIDIASRRAEIGEGIQELRLNKTIKFLETQGEKIGKKTYTVEDEFDADGNLVKSAGEKAQEIYDEYVKENPGTEQMDVSNEEAWKVGNIAVINKNLSKQRGAISVGSHETFHLLVDDYFEGIDKKDRKKLIKDFKNLLSKSQLDAINKRIQDNYMGIEGFDPETSIEWFTAFSDAISAGQITFDESIGNKILNFVQEVLRKLGIRKEFENARQAYNFMKDYSKSVSKGQLSKRALKLSETPSVSKKLGFSKTDEQTINNFTKKEGKPMNQVEWLEFTGETNNEGELVNQIEIANAFEGAINAKIKGTNKEVQNYFGRDRDKVVEDFKDILDKRGFFDSKIEQFNPEINDNFSGYMAGIINNAYKDLLDKNTKRIKTVPTSKKIGGEESRATIGETLVSDEISPEDYTDMQLAQDKLKKIKPQQSKIAKKIDLTDNEINLAKRDIINFLRKTDRPAMTDPKKFFKALVDYTTGKGVQPGGFAKVIYDKLSLPKDGKLSTKNKQAFIREIAEDLIALNKVDPAVMRRSKWTPFYELEIKKMNPTQTQKAIDEGRIPSTTNLKAGNDLFKTLDPTVDEVVEYLNNIRPDVLKRKMPKFLGEVIVKNEFNEIIENPKQPVYDAKGNETDNTIDLSESITEKEVVRGAPQVREKIARPEGIKFSKTKDFKDITKSLSDIQIAQEISAVNKISEDLGVEPSEVLLNIKDNISKYKKLRNELKLKDGGAKNISSTNNFLELSNAYKSFIKNSIPKGKTFDDLPNSVQQAIIDTVGFGDTRVTIGEKPLTYKAMTNNVKGYSNLLKTVFGEDVLIGTGKKLKNIDAVFAPRNWGVFRKKVEKIVLQKNITPEQAKLQIEELLKAENKTIDETLNANRELLNRGYSSLINLIVENKNKNTLGVVADILEAQVNRATGIFKGMVPMTSFNMKPEKGNTKNENKLMHNEHLLELFNVNKDFLKLTNSFIEGKISEKELRSKTTNNVSKLQQAVISERMRVQKDASGASVRDFIDPLTFLGKDAVNQIPIGTFKLSSGNDFTGLNMAEFIAQNLSNVQIQKLAQVIRGKLSAEGIMVKSVLDNYSNYLKTKKSNIDNLSNNVIKFSKSSTNQDIVSYAKTVDEALKLARDPNAPVKKIRVFDFDDTLAKSKSLVFYNRPNESGKPVPNNKAIFMIGGPGSGKSNIGKGLQLGRDGWKVVNQDIFIETEKAKAGLPESEKDYTKEQRSKRAKIGAAGKKAAEAKMEKYTKAGNGMVIDGTGASYNATMKKVNKLKEQGYEVFMVHAKTSNEVALERNRARKERSLPDFIVEKTQESVNNNISQYKSDLGDNFIEIDTETIEYGKPLPKEFVDDAKARFYATERGKLNAEEFAEKGAGLIEEGFAMDFSDFNIVREGEKGPLFDVAKKIQKARGTDDVFVLTARAPEAQQAIYEFLKSEGLEIPLENITGLGNSTGEAKANWLVNKAAEGYNDFYFADDAYQNVKAVKDAMSVLDVKSKVQQAKVKFSKSVNKDFNKIIEQTTGIASEKVYSEAKAKVRGANKGNKKFFIPYSAEDFMGLIYPLLSKGKLGDSQMAWFKQNLLDPYARAQENLSADRLQLMEDFKTLKKALDVPKDLRKKTDSGFTKEQAVRVYLFNKAGFDVPGISKTDLNELLDLVNSDGVLKAFADQIFNITKGDGYAKPGENWLVGTITTDLIDVLNTVKRAKYLEQSGYTANAELIFSKENLNKLEAAYGTKYREAMENILGRMKSGKNRIFSGNRLSNRVLDYINNSTGAIMFFNTRSAVLQTISSINFLNWSFNNPIKAGAAFANQPQYWKDFVELINSDYLVDRRNGLKLNINESEIADAAATSKNKARAAINYILQKGFLPTQYADSFAIASGGATFYRNRINDLIKNQGMSEADAKKQAMLEWRETAEISQQSSDPSKISAQQASDLGRVILAFANTPMQYARIQKRALQDLVKGRGDAKTNVSKIIYYAVVQNLIFNALQSALFKLGFDEEEDEKKEKMYLKTANGMLDSQLRGLGLAGATVSVIKNFLTDIYERSGRKRPEYVDSIYKLLQISPPISSKISKVRQAAYQFDSKKRREEIFEKGFSIDNPAYEAGAKVISATVNVPLDRVYSKVDNISGAMSEDAETWQTIAMLAGWPKWNIMPKDEKQEQSNFKNGNVKITTFKTSAKPTKKKATKTKPKRKKVKLKFK